MAHKRIVLRSTHVILGDLTDTFKVKTPQARMLIRTLLKEKGSLTSTSYAYFCTESLAHHRYADYILFANSIRAICNSDINTPTT